MPNPYDSKVLSNLEIGGKSYKYYSLPALKDDRLTNLPYSIRVLLESAIRCCDNFKVRESDVETILDWNVTQHKDQEIAFTPSRVLLQDFTGVPVVVDLAAMRDAVRRLGGNPDRVNPLVPVDLVIDHSVQVDHFRDADSLTKNLDLEFQRNEERFKFLKWGQKAFNGLTIVPPGAGIVHQVNLEYLGRVVFNKDGVLYNDSLVGTDSHTPMINGLGVVGWGVGGIEAEAVMMGQPIAMVLPPVVGMKLTGNLPATATATDLVLTITKLLRSKNVVGKFVEFFGPGVTTLSIADRATISNMAPEYGATIGYFPVDKKAFDYLRVTGRTGEQLAYIEAYLAAQGLLRDYEGADPTFSEVVELDLSSIKPCLSGPKRPHDLVPLATMHTDFENCLANPVGFKGYEIAAEARGKTVPFSYQGHDYTLSHGSVVIAAITSCTNTSNPNVMIAAGLLAAKAVAAGLSVAPWVKTSLAPGSGVVTEYLTRAGLLPALAQLGYAVVGYGCTTCIGNSGPLPDPVAQAIEENDLVCAGVLSGNRNFEGRIHQSVRANYLASPPLVVAYALAGTVRIDFESQPIGQGTHGPVFLRDIWPTHAEIAAAVEHSILPTMFTEVYEKVSKGTVQWNQLQASNDKLYPWDEKSSYIHSPPFFASMERAPTPSFAVSNAACYLYLGDSITTDHISPAGNISARSPAGRFLQEKGVAPADFNSYGARRGHDEVMSRGTFANNRLLNKFVGKAASKTVHLPSGEVLDIYDAAARYAESKTPLCILAGAMYGSGSSRDWAAKGVWMHGVKFVIAVSYERIHRSNLVLFGVIPFQFKAGEDAESLGLTGKESFSFDLGSSPRPGQDVTIHLTGGTRDTITVQLRFDTETEVTYYAHGGALNYVIRQLLEQ